MMSKAEDIQVGGSHYKSMEIQPMRYSMKNNLNACQHTAIKYITRYKSKGGIQDLKKAIHTIELLIEFEEEKLRQVALLTAERERAGSAKHPGEQLDLFGDEDGGGL